MGVGPLQAPPRHQQSPADRHFDKALAPSPTPTSTTLSSGGAAGHFSSNQLRRRRDRIRRVIQQSVSAAWRDCIHVLSAHRSDESISPRRQSLAGDCIGDVPAVGLWAQ